MGSESFMHKRKKEMSSFYPHNVVNVHNNVQQAQPVQAEIVVKTENGPWKVNSVFPAAQVQDAKCIICGANGASLYAATQTDQWVLYRKAYNKSMKKFLCISCKKHYRPSLSLSLLTRDKQAIRSLPVFDENGNLLPTTVKEQIKLLPQHFPIDYLGDRKAIVTIVEVTELIDCRVIKLLADRVDEYFVKLHMKEHGYILTIVPLWYEILRFPYPKTVQLTNFFDRHDKLRTTITYNEKKFVK